MRDKAGNREKVRQARYYPAFATGRTMQLTPALLNATVNATRSRVASPRQPSHRQHQNQSVTQSAPPLLQTLSQHLPDADATVAMGVALAAEIRPGMVIFLSGDLGAGKTTLTRGLLQALGVTGRIKSPTYSLVEVYAVSSLNLYHFDFYRFSESSEWSDAGFREHFDGGNVCLVEWPEKAAGQLPPPDLWIHLESERDGRLATVAAHTDAGRRCLLALPSCEAPSGVSQPDSNAP